MKMINRRNIIWVAGITVIMLFGILKFIENMFPVKYSMEAIKTDAGWGYKIMKNGKTIIYQESIPGLKGTAGFSSPQAAEMTGKIVLRRIKRGKMPSLSGEEVNQVLSNDRIEVTKIYSETNQSKNEACH
jgi:hypothetical protein